MEQERSEVGGGEAGSGDEGHWRDWEVETSDGSSGSNSDSEGWIDVGSNDDEDLEISDSDSASLEKVKKGGVENGGDNDAETDNMQLDTGVAAKIQTLATTKVKKIISNLGVLIQLTEMFRSLHPLTSP